MLLQSAVRLGRRQGLRPNHWRSRVMGTNQESSAATSTSSGSGKPHYLYAFDFDHTILDTNSDTAVTELLPSPLPSHIKKIYNGSNWTLFMNKVMEYIGSQGITPLQIFTKIQQLKFLKGMDTLLHRICSAREANEGSQLLIISDANDFFIEASLSGLKPPVVPNLIITNPCIAPTDGVPEAQNYLQVKPYETQTACPICPVNLCKGTALLKYIAEHGPFHSVYYFGDGGNDLCPAMKLTAKDTVFVRKGYALEKIIQTGCTKEKKIPVNIKAKIVYFENGTTLEQHLKF